MKKNKEGTVAAAIIITSLVIFIAAICIKLTYDGSHPVTAVSPVPEDSFATDELMFYKRKCEVLELTLHEADKICPGNVDGLLNGSVVIYGGSPISHIAMINNELAHKSKRWIGIELHVDSVLHAYANRWKQTDKSYDKENR